MPVMSARFTAGQYIAADARRKATRASTYTAQPVQNAAEIENVRAMLTLNTDASTDAAPLRPHSHGVSWAARVEASFIPIGNAIPMTSPAGNNSNRAAAILTGVDAAAVARTTDGVMAPKIARTTTNATRR